MNHIKENWTSGEVFHASDLNKIANTVNELIDTEEELIRSQETLFERVNEIVNDEEASSDSTFSSEKILDVVEEKVGDVINDEDVSDTSTFSSDKISEELSKCGIKKIVVDSLPEIGEDNAIYFTQSENIEPPVENSLWQLYTDETGKISLDVNESHEPISGMSIGDVFKYQNQVGSGVQYVVPSLIDKDNILLTFNMSSEAQEFVISGITETITLQDGHYYKLKDSYVLKGYNFDGNAAFSILEQGIGFEILVFEEVYAPTQVTYEDINFVPSTKGLEGCVYHSIPKLQTLLIIEEKTDPETHETIYIYTPIPPFASFINNYLPKAINVGDVIKTTGENIGYDNHPFVYVERVDDTVLELNTHTGLEGIIESHECSKNGYYRFTGYHRCKTYDEYADMYTAEIPTFELVVGAEVADYELEGLPGFTQGVRTKIDMYDEWMWLEGGWEQIGSSGGAGPTDDYYTKEQTNELLGDKQDVIDDLNDIRNGASLGATALQSESDPTVPAWAKQPNKPTYTAAEVGAIASLNAGANISVNGNSISAIGYTYDTTKNSFAEGNSSEATNEFSHAEGNGTHATGPASHAEGSVTWANGNNSHAEGIGTHANGWCSHAEGDGTETSSDNSCEHAEGRFNASHTGETDAEKTRHSIGIGSDNIHRANAFEVMANGDVYIKGVGDYDGTNPTSAQTVSQVISGKADASHTHTIVDVSGLTEVLDEFSEVVSSHINEIEENIEAIGFEELEYDEYALYTQESENIMAHGLVSKIGKTVTMQIYEAKTVNGTRDVSYILPYAPNTAYTAIINSEGVRECNGITYKVSLQTVTVGQTDYSVLTLNHYVSGTIADWGVGQNIAFRLDYIAA